jgi:glycine dehydrogenase subunit 2
VSFENLLKETGVSAEDVAKALLDRGLHAPTIYFPLIVKEAHMIEVTETETKENIDRLAKAYEEIVELAYRDPQAVKSSPTNTSVKRLDVLVANHPKTMAPTYEYLSRLRGQET